MLPTITGWATAGRNPPTLRRAPIAKRPHPQGEAFSDGSLHRFLAVEGPSVKGVLLTISPSSFMAAKALAARHRGQGGAPGAQRGRTTLRTAAASKKHRAGRRRRIRP